LQGFLYLAVITDAISRRVVGWSMANHLKTGFIVDAPDMALWTAARPGLECEFIDCTSWRTHTDT
jgi:transposase InsO family protein